MPIWAQDNIGAAAELSVIEAITKDVLDVSKRRRDIEEALRQQTSLAVAGQLKEDEEFWMDHETGSESLSTAG